MATSSIFANVRITDPKKAESFVNALEASAKEPKGKPFRTDYSHGYGLERNPHSDGKEVEIEE